MKRSMLFFFSLLILQNSMLSQSIHGNIDRLRFTTKPQIINHWENNGVDEFEGVYSISGIIGDFLVVKLNNGYQMFHIDWSKDYDFNTKDFHLSDIIYILDPTADKNIFHLKVYSYLDDFNKDNIGYRYLVKLDGSSFVYDIAQPKLGVKTYPTDYDIIKKKSAKQDLSSSATGFAISSNGIIVTNYHVVENAKKIKVRGLNSDFTNYFKAKVILIDKNNDLVLIQIIDERFTKLKAIPYNLKSTQALVGESVFVLGYPLKSTMGDEVKLTNGIISSRTGFQGDVTSYQISAPVQPGNSGGPLLDNNGNIIGVVTSKHVDTENVSYAIKSIYLSNLLDNLPDFQKPATANVLLNKNLSQQVEIIKEFVFIIEVE